MERSLLFHWRTQYGEAQCTKTAREKDALGKAHSIDWDRRKESD